MTKRTYPGADITVLWDSERCIHTAICLRTLPAVFDLDQRPWIDVAGADADTIAAAVERCPTGALRYARADGSRDETPDVPTTVVARPNGPLFVRGDIEVRNTAGEVVAHETRLALCRCGSSQNQPFCDLSHRRIGFRDNRRLVTDERATALSPVDIRRQEEPAD